MNQEKQRIAIAVACGWRHKERVFEVGVQIELGGWYDPDRHYYGEHTSDLPDYLNSLDTVHEAVGVLTDEQRAVFRTHLRTIWVRDYNARCGLFPDHDDAINATAAQRAEAFLKTLGLWTEEE